LLFALGEALWLLSLAALMLGCCLAVAFQCGILAATRYFDTRRTGTAFHEAIVGAGGLAAFPFGLLIQAGKARGWSEVDALRLPFWAVALGVLVAFGLQLWCVSRRVRARRLLT